ncbi:MAG: glycosyltransferase [Bdellovibrionales bacterium]
MTLPSFLKVAVLVDLPLTPLSGGHARGWARLAQAAAKTELPLDLTVYFSGKELTEELSPHVTQKHLNAVFSTKNLKFLPYVPDNTDLAPYHPRLAQELQHFDIIHTTDAFFAFARTAEKVSRSHNIPLVTSFHTDTPPYARVFTERTIRKIFGETFITRFLIETLGLPRRQEEKMNRRLRAHLRHCCHGMVTREKDKKLVEDICGPSTTSFMRTPIDRSIFGPHRRDRNDLETRYNIPKDKIICLFVGRLDEGKNIYPLIGACEKLLQEGLPLHLIAAGEGPAAKDLKARLGPHVTLAGFVQPQELGALYASVDILTMPSKVEMRSLVAIEAMISGLPVLLAKEGGVAAHYGYNEALMPVEDGADKWATALRTLIQDQNKRQKMGQAGLAYTNENTPDWEQFLKEDFLAIWQKIYEKAQS